MSIMPLLPTRLVSNIKFRIYTKKAWESYIFARPDAQASHASLSRTRSMQRPTHIWQHPLHHYGTTGELSLYAGIYCGFSWQGYELRVRASIKALVNAYSNIYVRKASLSARFPFRRCKDSENPSLSVQFLEKKNEFDAKNWRFRRILRKVE